MLAFSRSRPSIRAIASRVRIRSSTAVFSSSMERMMTSTSSTIPSVASYSFVEGSVCCKTGTSQRRVTKRASRERWRIAYKEEVLQQ
jgi:hypothetical protein